MLSVGLGACVYLWSACTSQVPHLRHQCCQPFEEHRFDLSCLGHPALWSHQRQWHSYVSLMGRAGQLCGSRHSQGLCPGDCWKLFHGAPFRMSGANIRLNIHILPQSLMSRSGTLQLPNASMFCQVTAPGDRSYCPSSFVLSNLEVWSSPLFSLGLEHWPGMVICWAAAVGTALFCREMSELQGLKWLD